MNKILFTVLLLVLIDGFAHSAIPKSIKLCSRKAKNLSNCVKDSVEHLRPFLKSGDLGDNFKVLSFEPFLIEEMKINPSADFLVHLKQVYLKGVSSFGIEKIKVDLKNTTIDVLVNLPVVTFNSKYNMAVKLAVLNIVGDGDCNGTMTNSRTRVRMIGSRYQKNGVEFLKIDDVNVRMKIGNISVHLDNLFNGDKALGDVGNQLVNENSDLLFKDIVPVVEKNLSKKFKSTANGILELASFDELFPDI